MKCQANALLLPASEVHMKKQKFHTPMLQYIRINVQIITEKREVLSNV